ncbi:MAG: Acyltransferase, partial [Frankiales bacterium]|nr:Acyltransferase [Frankiales bacterium]
MRSANRRYLYPVDHLRFYAATVVVFYHSTQLISQQVARRRHLPVAAWPFSRNPLKTVIFEGHTGVALFMVLSGFIFTIGTLDREVFYGRFMANRFLRIYPLYLVLVFIALS